jgi:hypothetical protein
VVPWTAGAYRSLNSTSPEPVREKVEVSSCFCSGNKKSAEQRLPAKEAGMSKLKMLLMLLETVPLNEVVYDLLGLDESTGIIR